MIQLRFGAATSIFLALLGSSCGGGQLPAKLAEEARPKDDDKAAAVAGEPDVVCDPGARFAEPLIVDLKPEERATLEMVMKGGVAVVSYDCKHLTVLRDCSVQGTYGFVGVSTKEVVHAFSTTSDIGANLPSLGPLPVEIGAQLNTGKSLNLAIVTVGRRRTTVTGATLADLKGTCDGATHLVRGADIGAFAMSIGTRAAQSATVQVFGAGAHEAGTSEKSIDRRDGELPSCKEADPDAESPPKQCRALVRLELQPLVRIEATPDAAAGAKAGGDADDDEAHKVAECPKGMVRAEGVCRAAAEVAAHACTPTDLADCTKQCDGGHFGSCTVLGDMYRFGRNGATADQAAAAKLYDKACAGGDAAACTWLGLAYEYGRGVTPDMRHAVELFKHSCDAGHAAGCNNLGFAKAKGLDGSPPDAEGSAKLYRRACDAGDKVACFNFAIRLLSGGGVDKDPARALELYTRSCDGGYGKACSNLGVQYSKGEVVTKDLPRALDLAARGCKLGDDIGCKNGAWLLEHGSGVPVDMDRAGAMYARSCTLGNMDACAALNTLVKAGKVKTDLAALTESFRKGCEAKNYKACESYARALQSGTGVAKDAPKALTLLTQACDEDLGSACNSVGFAYDHAVGTAEDTARAYTNFARSCKLGFGEGCTNAGLLANGGRGTTKDEAGAVTHWERACELSHGRGCFQLSEALRTGRGGKKDAVRAGQLLRQACTLAYAPACTKLKESSAGDDKAADPKKPSDDKPTDPKKPEPSKGTAPPAPPAKGSAPPPAPAKPKP